MSRFRHDRGRLGVCLFFALASLTFATVGTLAARAHSWGMMACYYLLALAGIAFCVDVATGFRRRRR